MRYCSFISCVSPLSSGFISAVTRNFTFGAPGQGVLLLKQSHPRGKKNLGRTHTASYGSVHISAHGWNIKPVSPGFVLEKFYMTW